MATDAEYRFNQKRAQQAWLKLHPNYWKEYRQGRAQQRDHFCEDTRGDVAKMDSIFPGLSSGQYRLSRVIDGDAKMDSITVEIRVMKSS